MTYKHIKFEESEVLREFERKLNSNLISNAWGDSGPPQKFEESVQKELANPSSSLSKNVQTIIKVVGFFPTPWGNPISIIAAMDAYKNHQFDEVFFYLLSAIPGDIFGLLFKAIAININFIRKSKIICSFIIKVVGELYQEIKTANYITNAIGFLAEKIAGLGILGTKIGFQIELSQIFKEQLRQFHNTYIVGIAESANVPCPDVPTE